MFDGLKKFIQIIHEVEKEQTLNLADPEDLRKFEIKWKLLHQRHERFIQGAKLLLMEESLVEEEKME